MSRYNFTVRYEARRLSLAGRVTNSSTTSSCSIIRLQRRRQASSRGKSAGAQGGISESSASSPQHTLPHMRSS